MSERMAVSGQRSAVSKSQGSREEKVAIGRSLLQKNGQRYKMSRSGDRSYRTPNYFWISIFPVAVNSPVVRV